MVPYKPFRVSGWNVKAAVSATAFVDLLGDPFGIPYSLLLVQRYIP
jgi:hypothetical protein